MFITNINSFNKKTAILNLLNLFLLSAHNILPNINFPILFNRMLNIQWL